MISSGSVTGTVGSATISGAADNAGAWSSVSGFYSGSALFGVSGNINAVVGADGRAFVVESLGSSADAASGALDSNGRHDGRER